jgi:hypothetical protein
MSGDIIDKYARSVLIKLREEVFFVELMTGSKPKELLITKLDYDALKSFNQFNMIAGADKGEFNTVLGIKIRVVK